MPKPAQTVAALRLFRLSLGALAFTFLSSSAIPLRGEDAAAAKPADKPAPKAAAKKEEPSKPEETVFFTVRAGSRRALGRTDAEAKCKGYLGRPGQGWLPFPDPKIQGDDLAAVSNHDGTKFALLSTREGSLNLWLVSGDGRSFERLSDDDAGILPVKQALPRTLSFTQDGKKLAFVMRGEAWVMDLATRQPLCLTKGGGVMALAWSPNGKWLAVVQGQSVHKIAWSGHPDLLVASDACDQPSLAWSQDDLYFYGRGIQRVTGQRQVDLLQPSTSLPNMLALVGPKDIALLAPSTAGVSEVHLASLGGSKGPTLTPVTQGGAQGVWASAGGKTLFFMRDRVLWRCDLNGQKARPLGNVPMDSISLGQLLPLKGVCQ